METSTILEAIGIIAIFAVILIWQDKIDKEAKKEREKYFTHQKK